LKKEILRHKNSPSYFEEVETQNFCWGEGQGKGGWKTYWGWEGGHMRGIRNVGQEAGESGRFSQVSFKSFPNELAGGIWQAEEEQWSVP